MLRTPVSSDAYLYYYSYVQAKVVYNKLAMSPNQDQPNPPPPAGPPAGPAGPAPLPTLPPTLPTGQAGPRAVGQEINLPPGIYPNVPDPYSALPSDGSQQPSGPPPVPAEPPKQRWEHTRSVISTILLLILAPLIALAITAFAFQSYQVEGASMEKTLSNNDRLIVNKLARTWARITNGHYTPTRGEVVIFNQAGLYDSEGQPQKQLIKRVVGLPGERVVVKENKVIVYNDKFPEGFNPDKDNGYSISADETPGDVDTLVEENEVFVLGDNRTNSEDSRYFGPISTQQIVGKLTFRISPLDKIQKF